MERSFLKRDVTVVETQALVVNLYQGVERPAGATGAVDRALGGQITRLIEQGEITGRLGEVTIVHTDSRFPAERVVVLGLGKKEECDLEKLRSAMGSVTGRLLKHKVKRFHTILHGGGDLEATGATVRDLAQAMTEAAVMAGYRFDRFKTAASDENKGPADLEGITVVDVDGRKGPAVRRGMERGETIARAVNYTRDLGNLPPNEMTPVRMAEAAVELAEEFGLEVEVFDRKRLQKERMGGILGVGQGSANEPRLIVLRHRGREGKTRPFVVVGKAITFDTGGISIKPSRNMEEMKFDKMGGCAVLGILRAAAELELKIDLIGVVPAAENMPSGTAYRPGDILESRTGKTIEIINTDAEGRLILADALEWASEQEPREIVDLATLTGACVVALGHYASGAFGDEAMVTRFKEIGDRTGDRAWPMPLFKEFREDIDSKVADIKNSGGPWGGASTAAAFLEFFVGDGIPWVHLDIAGTAYVTKPGPYAPVGATGAGVRLVTEYLASR